MSEEKKAKPAVEAEAVGDEVRVVEWDGDSWEVAVDGDGWPLAAGLAFSEIVNMPDIDYQGARGLKYVATFIEGVVGQVQWARFSRKPGRKTSDLRRFFDAILTQAYGFKGSGEAEASSD